MREVLIWDGHLTQNQFEQAYVNLNLEVKPGDENDCVLYREISHNDPLNNPWTGESEPAYYTASMSGGAVDTDVDNIVGILSQTEENKYIFAVIDSSWIKMVSVIIENAIKVPILIPAIVMTGINPFFKACL